MPLQRNYFLYKHVYVFNSGICGLLYGDYIFIWGKLPSHFL